MIGLDTNVLARYIVRDDPAQTALADHCIECVFHAHSATHSTLIRPLISR